jgi:hypothetical protein
MKTIRMVLAIPIFLIGALLLLFSLFLQWQVWSVSIDQMGVFAQSPIVVLYLMFEPMFWKSLFISLCGLGWVWLAGFIADGLNLLD